jgi:hypothetical protein
MLKENKSVKTTNSTESWNIQVLLQFNHLYLKSLAKKLQIKGIAKTYHHWGARIAHIKLQIMGFNLVEEFFEEQKNNIR